MLYVTPGTLAENSMAVLSLPPATAINILLCYTMFSYPVLIWKINFSILFYSILFYTPHILLHLILFYISSASHFLIHIDSPTFPSTCQQPHISFYILTALHFVLHLISPTFLLHIISTTLLLLTTSCMIPSTQYYLSRIY